MKEVVTLKLISGEEIIGEMVNETLEGIKIKAPHMLMLMPGQGVAFIPYLLSCKDEEITIQKEYIIVQKSSDKAYIEQYQSNMSDIVAPSKQIVTSDTIIGG